MSVKRKVLLGWYRLVLAGLFPLSDYYESWDQSERMFALALPLVVFMRCNSLIMLFSFALQYADGVGLLITYGQLILLAIRFRQESWTLARRLFMRCEQPYQKEQGRHDAEC